MVDITIYVEGGGKQENVAAQTVDNSAVFRENFYKLFWHPSFLGLHL